MFVKAFLNGSRQMVEASSDLERLQFMPQKIEGGNVIDFTGRTLFKGLDINDTEIFDASRVNDAKRITAALKRDYFIGLDKVMHLFNDGSSASDLDEGTPAEEYGADIYDAIANGDKKGLRTVLKEYKKVKWAALNEDDVEDAIYDLNDCIVGKDVDSAKEIVTELIGEDICEVKETEVKETTESTHTPANEDEAELIVDLEEALADKDYEDVEMLLKELGEKHPRYSEFASRVPGNEDEAPADDSQEYAVITEICEDIDASIKEGDIADAKKFLEELATEAGKDSDVYKEYEAKVNPPKTTRRKRRGK